MHTGDLAEMREDGYCNIVGRIKDMVIRGGENIYPREIEEFLYPHPDIEDVQVIGVPDEKYGEELCAWIKLRAGADAARRRRRPRVLRPAGSRHYKIPRYVMVVDEFPMTVTGKIRKVADARGDRREARPRLSAAGRLSGGSRHPEASAADLQDPDDAPQLSPRARALLDRIDAWSGHSRVRKVLVRAGVTVAGPLVVLAGVAMLVLPGPGLVVIALGLALLALEYEWARGLVGGLGARRPGSAAPCCPRTGRPGAGSSAWAAARRSSWRRRR